MQRRKAESQPNQIRQVLESEDQRVRDFWTRNEANEKEKFLKDFILNKKWIDKEGAGSNDEDQEESEHSLLVDEFEHNHNFRFEHGTTSVKAARNTEDTLRTKESR